MDLTARGHIVSVQTDVIKPKPGGKEFTPFTKYTVWLTQDSGRRPSSVTFTDKDESISAALATAAAGDEVIFAGYVRAFPTAAGAGWEFCGRSVEVVGAGLRDAAAS